MSSPSEEVRNLLGLLGPGEGAGEELTSLEIREAFARYVAAINSRGPWEAVGSTVDKPLDRGSVHVPLRVYEPPIESDVGQDVILFFHGGGWIAGDLETADSGARSLAAHFGARVISVGYRLAPESPFPAAFEDCLAVLEDVLESPNTRKVFLAGESAGGNLAAAVAIAARDANLPIEGQLLINPVLDTSTSQASYVRYGAGYGLTAADMRRYIAWYAGNNDPRDPSIAPLLATSLRGVAPTVLVTAGFDPLHDEGFEYAARLMEAEVMVTYLPLPTMLHGWWSLLPASADAQEALQQVVRAAGSLRIGERD